MPNEPEMQAAEIEKRANSEVNKLNQQKTQLEREARQLRNEAGDSEQKSNQNKILAGRGNIDEGVRAYHLQLVWKHSQAAKDKRKAERAKIHSADELERKKGIQIKQMYDQARKMRTGS